MTKRPPQQQSSDNIVKNKAQLGNKFIHSVQAEVVQVWYNWDYFQLQFTKSQKDYFVQGKYFSSLSDSKKPVVSVK